jgi:pimeloyl-ACP methyl ester carboxylesterase
MTGVAGMASHTVTGGDGLRLHVREWGNPDGPPILFIHGLSQSHLCWYRQYLSDLADEFRLVAYDMRGHGMSEAPLGQEHYARGRLWADDLAGVIRELELDRPVMVGWSYGGFVIGDYIRAYGQDRIAAINFVGCATTLDASVFGTLIGPGFLDHFPGAVAADLPTNIQAMRGLVKAFSAHPLPPDDVETLLGASMAVPAPIRANLATRQVDVDDVLRDLHVPLLVTQGRADTLVLPATAEHILAICPTAKASWYDGIGHVPFLEQADRFNRELAELTRRAQGPVLGPDGVLS